jgi:hypothetical protein
MGILDRKTLMRKNLVYSKKMVKYDLDQVWGMMYIRMVSVRLAR